MWTKTVDGTLLKYRSSLSPFTLLGISTHFIGKSGLTQPYLNRKLPAVPQP